MSNKLYAALSIAVVAAAILSMAAAAMPTTAMAAGCNERGITYGWYGYRYAYSHDDVVMVRSIYAATTQVATVPSLVALGLSEPHALILLAAIRTSGWWYAQVDQGCGIYIYDGLYITSQ